MSIMPDVRETYMVRYGGDMEMNLNLFLKPEEAKEELNMKLEAQTEVSRERWVWGGCVGLG